MDSLFFRRYVVIFASYVIFALYVSFASYVSFAPLTFFGVRRICSCGDEKDDLFFWRYLDSRVSNRRKGEVDVRGSFMHDYLCSSCFLFSYSAWPIASSLSVAYVCQ